MFSTRATMGPNRPSIFKYNSPMGNRLAPHPDHPNSEPAPCLPTPGATGSPNSTRATETSSAQGGRASTSGRAPTS
eukprot:9474225-Pyramimonas_sp.AAC.2